MKIILLFSCSIILPLGPVPLILPPAVGYSSSQFLYTSQKPQKICIQVLYLFTLYRNLRKYVFKFSISLHFSETLGNMYSSSQSLYTLQKPQKICIQVLDPFTLLRNLRKYVFKFSISLHFSETLENMNLKIKLIFTCLKSSPVNLCNKAPRSILTQLIAEQTTKPNSVFPQRI